MGEGDAVDIWVGGMRGGRVPRRHGSIAPASPGSALTRGLSFGVGGSGGQLCQSALIHGRPFDDQVSTLTLVVFCGTGFSVTSIMCSDLG